MLGSFDGCGAVYWTLLVDKRGLSSRPPDFGELSEGLAERTLSSVMSDWDWQGGDK